MSEIETMIDPLEFVTKHIRLWSNYGEFKFMVPNKDQEEILRAYERGNELIARVLPRQVSKTSVATAILLHYVYHNPDKTVVVLSHTLQSAASICSRVGSIHDDCTLKNIFPLIKRNKFELEFSNRSKILFKSCNSNLRGYSIDFLYEDEGQFYKHTPDGLPFSLIDSGARVLQLSSARYHA